MLVAFLSAEDHDIIFISETFLDSTTKCDDPSIKIDGYEFRRKDHPSNEKRGGVCVYYKEHLPLKVRNDLTSLEECIVCEIKVNGQNCFVSGLSELI